MSSQDQTYIAHNCPLPDRDITGNPDDNCDCDYFRKQTGASIQSKGPSIRHLNGARF